MRIDVVLAIGAARKAIVGLGGFCGLCPQQQHQLVCSAYCQTAKSNGRIYIKLA